MQFQRLRIAGFKSFVDPVDIPIEPGLTGVVGPNGCGKSNLLEALRWVMGASSAKAMRGGAMDDVIFGGSGGRPARNHAEVRLLIDNSLRHAPAGFNDHDAIEVVRRIDRGAGSTYRVNGAEARARDVQLLFADASTGANSPSLVRQGQISELIAAKPANRRRILEEAAGVSGLHARRHEAELKLSAAGANLDRLEDVARELDTQLGRLKREAGRAETYKRLAAEIRGVEAAVLHARWRDATGALESAQTALAEAELAAGETAREVARANAAALSAADGIGPLREAATTASAVAQHLVIARDRIEREAEAAAATQARAEADLARIAADRARETAATEDAEAERARAARDLADVEAQITASPERIPALETALAAAAAARAEADTAVERLAAAAAAAAASRRANAARRDEAAAARRAASARLEDARARLVRTRADLAAVEAESDALSKAAGQGPAAEVERALAAAQSALADARAKLEAAEQDRATAQAAEAATRDAWRKADDGLRQLLSEAQGLVKLTAAASTAAGKHALALDRTSPAMGYEAALAAALGDDLDAALDAKAPSNWAAGREVDALPPPWPRGATPLANHVDAPPELRGRLALTALVDRADGARLQRLIPTGARLVSREGDLWRWDGFTMAAAAPRPAAVRLAQRSRLAEVETGIARLTPERDALGEAHRAAQTAVREAETAVGAAKPDPVTAERDVTAAREIVERKAREAARDDARREALSQSADRLTAEVAQFETSVAALGTEDEAARARLAAADADAETLDAPDNARPLEAARAASSKAREEEARARSTLDGERRAREGRQRRRDGLAREAGDWSRRAEAAAARSAALVAEADRARQALDAAREAPATLAERLARASDELVAAETRRSQTADSLAEAESTRTAADRTLRAAETAAAESRERRAGDVARVEAANERLAETLEAVRSQAGVEPEELASRISQSALAVPPDPASLDTHLRALLARRDSLGPVNLRAAEEAAEAARRLDEMDRERSDLAAAIVKLRTGVEALNAEGRERLLAAFTVVDENFRALFSTLFEGGEAELRLVESPDPLEAGLEIYACPPGKRLSTMSLMSGGEQALTATALIFAVFLANPSPVCVLDEVDAPLDDANVDRFCRMLDAMRTKTATRFIAITHNPVTMSRMDRLFGVTMAERGVSQLVSVDLARAEALVAE